jgi:acetyl/propionyl-CoA carboxylase alpha subunit
MFTVTVNDQDTSYHIRFEKGQPLLNDAAFGWDIVSLPNRPGTPNQYSILRGGRSFTAEVVTVDAATKTVTLLIDGTRQVVQLRDRFDLLLEQMGMSQTVSSRLTDLKAPMPGLIVSVNAAPGQTVQKGDILLVLEAMKMENTLKASAEATIKTIRIHPGDRVEKGQVLVEFA